MSTPLRVGIVGYGKIARDEHHPAIDANPNIQLTAIATLGDGVDGLPSYASVTEMLTSEPELDAVTLCQPPQFRHAAAREALLAGKHVFLEKPPGLNCADVIALEALAVEQGVTLFTAWHSRYARHVAAAKQWCAQRRISSIAINWKEDVRHWHPGQQWIWEEGGFGVFDPGINALSILTEILPEPVAVVEATLETPTNCAMPIAAMLAMQTAGGIPIAAEFDFRQTGPQSWDILITADNEQLCLGHGGHSLNIANAEGGADIEGEYAAMYRQFVTLVQSGQSDVDCAPLQIVEEAFRIGTRIKVEAFVE